MAGLHVAKTSRFWGSRFEARLVIAGSSTAYRGKPLIFSGKNPLWSLFVCPTQGVDLSLPLIGPAAAVLSTVRTRDEVRLVTNPVNRCNAGRAGGKITRSELGDASSCKSAGSSPHPSVFRRAIHQRDRQLVSVVPFLLCSRHLFARKQPEADSVLLVVAQGRPECSNLLMDCLLFSYGSTDAGRMRNSIVSNDRCSCRQFEK